MATKVTEALQEQHVAELSSAKAAEPSHLVTRIWAVAFCFDMMVFLSEDEICSVHFHVISLTWGFVHFSVTLQTSVLQQALLPAAICTPCTRQRPTSIHAISVSRVNSRPDHAAACAGVGAPAVRFCWQLARFAEQPSPG